MNQKFLVVCGKSRDDKRNQVSRNRAIRKKCLNRSATWKTFNRSVNRRKHQSKETSSLQVTVNLPQFQLLIFSGDMETVHGVRNSKKLHDINYKIQ